MSLNAMVTATSLNTTCKTLSVPALLWTASPVHEGQNLDDDQAWELSKEKTSETRGVQGHAPPEFFPPLHSNLCNLGAFNSIKSGCSKEKSPTFKAVFIIVIIIL